jgi:hypothetical protein
MPYRAMALVAASLLFATQCWAATTVRGTRSKQNSDKQTTQTGGNSGKVVETSRSNNFREGSTKGGGSGARDAQFGWDIGANKERTKSGGGGGKGATGNYGAGCYWNQFGRRICP